MYRFKPIYLAVTLLMLTPGAATAACADDTSKLDEVLARYEKNAFSCSRRSTTDLSATTREIEYGCTKSTGTGPLRRFVITATVDRAGGCDVVRAVGDKPFRNTEIRGLCRPGGPCNHGNYARP